MIKLLGLAALVGVVAVGTPTEIPPAFREEGIAALCQAEGHQVESDTYETCLEDERTLALVRDIVERHGGLSGLDRTYHTFR